MKNKRGQFYLIAAIIIVLVLSSLASIRIYANVNAEPKKIQDLGSELNVEGYKIVEYGIYNQGDITQLLNNFTDKDFVEYFLQKTEATDLVFLYGNKTDLYGVRYNNTITGTITATVGSGVTWNTVNTFVERKKIESGDIIDNKVEVKVLNKPFNFTLQDNEMFYFIIVQEKNGEVYVTTNK
jgi:hypothetical protein